jgi:hypothetical protein
MAASVPLSSVSFAVFFYPPFVFIFFLVIKVDVNPFSHSFLETYNSVSPPSES